jgi:hypothetical protein
MATKGMAMNRLWRILVLVLSLFWTVSAHASSDSTCYPDWKLKQTDRSGCSSTALLSPGNDTRVNLLMLLKDRHGTVGQAGRYSYYLPDRRGEAEPFGYSVFAETLGPSPKSANDDDSGGFAVGTRCISNITGGAAFIAALEKVKGIPSEERATLAAVRTTLKPECVESEQARAVVEQAVSLVKSKQGLLFARYLIGAAAFYDGDFPAAKTAFSGIGKTDSAWLAEAASYMQGRAALGAAMAGAFDEYGSLSTDAINKETLGAAERGFLAYLKAYPNGQYAPSARGLMRRVYWLGKRSDELAAEYAAQFAQKDAGKRNISLPDLVQEIDVKLLTDLKPATVSDPMLLAIVDLRAMRNDGDPKQEDYGEPAITRVALTAQRSRFAGNDALFNYLLAAHAFYVANDPADVLKLIPANTQESGSYLGYSRQLLRALALDASGNPAARQALLGLVTAAKQPFQRGSAELALALHDERNKGVDRVFAANSLVRDADLREILLRYHAGPALLRTRYADKSAPKQERQVALYTLLYKQLTRGAYGDFIRDVALIPADARPKPEDDYATPVYTDIARFRWDGSKEFVCPSLKTVATTLSAKPKDAASTLCLGEFIRESGFDPDYYGVTQYLDDQPDKDELGGTPSLFPGKRFSRLEGYKGIIADPAAGANNKAYALYRAVYCFAPSGYNGCDGADIPKSQRKAWFQKLKTDYPTSPWATKMKYYW